MAIENTPRAKRSNAQDTDSEAMIYDGCNLTQLAKIFRTERRIIQPKLREVPSCGTRGGYPIYYIHEVAPHVVKPVYDIEQYIMRMNHNDLPKMVSKEFWNGLKAKQDYLLREGELWPTDDIIEVMGETFKTLRMSMLLMGDALERETSLTIHQRERLRAMIDGALNDLADSLITRFTKEAVTDVSQSESEI